METIALGHPARIVTPLCTVLKRRDIVTRWVAYIAHFAPSVQLLSFAALGANEQLSPYGRIWAIASQEVTMEVTYPSNSASNALASCKSAVSNPCTIIEE